ncbi:hypothetical protein POM88_011454 [Heracleum sosnowskyi]|uniref:Uncharacterized protein n=1 Tax=Heracleum sosnowskyi TaxID=360622 RepID=A0AAD8IWU8_9APIA|nr:hypothetical protein POM88_011454 [Heracleum sosnowskyi]
MDRIIRKTWECRKSEAVDKKRSSAKEEEYADCRDRGIADGGDENHLEVNIDSLDASAGLVGNFEMPAWGRVGIRSNTHHRNQNAGNTRTARSTGLARLLESYQDTVEQTKYVAANIAAKSDEINILLCNKKNWCVSWRGMRHWQNFKLCTVLLSMICVLHTGRSYQLRRILTEVNGIKSEKGN